MSAIADIDEARQQMRAARARSVPGLATPASEQGSPGTAVAMVREFVAGLSSIATAFDQLSEQRNLLQQQVAAAPAALEQAPVMTASGGSIDLRVVGRDAANRIRRIAINADDGRAWTLDVTGRDGGDNIQGLRLTPTPAST